MGHRTDCHPQQMLHSFPRWFYQLYSHQLCRKYATVHILCGSLMSGFEIFCQSGGCKVISHCGFTLYEWVSLHIGHLDFCFWLKPLWEQLIVFPWTVGSWLTWGSWEGEESPGVREVMTWSPGWNKAGAWLQWQRQAERAPQPGGLTIDPMPWCLWQQNVYLSPTLSLSELGKKSPRSEGHLVRLRGVGGVLRWMGRYVTPASFCTLKYSVNLRWVEKSSKYHFFSMNFFHFFFNIWQLIIKSQFGPNKLCLLALDLVVRRPLCDLFGHETGFIPWSVGKYYLLPGARILRAQVKTDFLERAVWGDLSFSQY